MMKQRILPLLLLFMAIHLCLPRGEAIAAEQQFMLFYSNDVLGETEPCG